MLVRLVRFIGRRSLLRLALLVVVSSSAALAQSVASAPKIKLPAQAKSSVLSAKAIASKTLPSVVLIVASNGNDSSLGSGFFIADGIVITNYHVIKGMRKGMVRVAIGKDNQKRDFRIARVLDFDEESDLAILSVPAAKNVLIPNLALGSDSLPDIGEAIYALGNPEGLVGTITPGIISAGVRLREKKSRLQITAPISSGSSGGPVVNERAEVIAVVVSTLSEGQNLNFAIPVLLVRQLIDRVTLPNETQAASDLVYEVSDGRVHRDWVWHRQNPTQNSAPSIVRSQENQDPVILWNADDKVCCSLGYLNGAKVLGIHTDDVSVFVRAALRKKEVQFYISVANQGSRSIDVLPGHIRLGVVETGKDLSDPSFVWLTSLPESKLNFGVPVLKANTVFTGKSVSGYVVFKLPRRPMRGVLGIHINGTRYGFEFDF